jgi:hypothetical protein
LVKKEKMLSVSQSVISVISATATHSTVATDGGDDHVHYVHALFMFPMLFEMEALKMEVMVVVF